jgi:hypothetical protein
MTLKKIPSRKFLAGDLISAMSGDPGDGTADEPADLCTAFRPYIAYEYGSEVSRSRHVSNSDVSYLLV